MTHVLRTYSAIALLVCTCAAASAQRQLATKENIAAAKANQPKIVEPTAWTAIQPLGLREEMPVDTLEQDYYQRSVPSYLSPAWACTGNLGAEGTNMIYMDREQYSSFFLTDAFRPWLPQLSALTFFNTGIPVTQVQYNTGGGRDDSQDRLQVIFTANANKRTQFGANLDYLYSKGSYEDQAAKHLNWGFSGSYMGDRFEFMGSWNHYNSLNKENGGITDDLYITDPAELQGGISTINPKSIPTNLKDAHTRIVGGELFLNSRYKLGYWKEEEVDDSVVNRTFIPVTSFVWTVNFRNARHRFDDTAADASKFFEHTYLDAKQTWDVTSYNELSNTVGVSLLEGFNKYAKMGLSAYLTYTMRHFKQTADTLPRDNPEAIGLSPFPAGIASIDPKATENLAWVGAQLTKQQGSILTYEATGELGIVGAAAADVKLRGRVSTRIPLLGDTVSVTGYGSFMNTTAPYLLNNYLSNHFIWHNSFGKERRLRLGGILTIPWTSTMVNVGVENVQNLIYFDDAGLPAQCGASIQVVSATLQQNFRFGILHWDNRVTVQKSSDDYVLPLPQVAVFSNLYLKCRIATLKLQLGVDCDYYTRYYAPGFSPATATFHNQHEIQVGNYPFMTAYANMKLGRTRFYIMMTHVSQGMFGNSDYFSLPHYPLNPRRLQMGLSVDFFD